MEMVYFHMNLDSINKLNNKENSGFRMKNQFYINTIEKLMESEI